ncbi:MAG: fibronectin type III domain-containing protein [Patescibacteria group bacterium]|nr:fibronectin type III domain-containing protein [Patescibacteria group bacterium]
MLLHAHRNLFLWIFAPLFFSVVISVAVVTNVRAATINATITAGIFAPGAPANLAVSISDKSVDLSWSPPSSNGGSTITDYVIEYKTTNGSTWSTFPDGNNINTVGTVSGLSNDTSYDFRVSAVNSIDQGPASSVVSGTPGAPAQVIINSISDTTVPSIAASVRITNEGVTAYEYQYTWCVTDSDTNLCGGGNDVFSSSAAKLIQPGVDFDTTLNATVSSVGSYWFHLDAQFGSDSSHASQSLTATAEPSSGGSGGGGGGGGGGSGIVPSTSTVSGNAADLTGDGKVNGVDFSILLAFWKTSPPFKNPAVDMNKDGKVDSVDFSILLYNWENNIYASLF